ncbi:hypothetical protein HY994_00780 [Candidatus Micrarchaeota archaeon]|nr:hypothetical protein [Candidatus Micrarchaeota archaeon]
MKKHLASKPAIAVGALIVLLVGLALVFASPFAPSGFSSFSDWHNATGWLNSEALSWSDLQGTPTVVYFWSGTCERCLGDGMDLARNWSRRSGLNWVWVHAPEFAFERDVAVAQSDVTRLRLQGPVALDHQGVLWSAYSNRSQNILYVIAANGTMLYSANRADASLGGPLYQLASGNSTVFPTVSPSSVRRIYTGYETSVQGIRKNWTPYREADYLFSVQPIPFVPELFGKWYVGGDFIRAQTQGQIRLVLTNVSRLSLVAQAFGTVKVFESNLPLSIAQRGAAMVEQDGLTVFSATSAGLYDLARNLPEESEIRMDVPAGFTLYRFSLD